MTDPLVGHGVFVAPCPVEYNFPPGFVELQCDNCQAGWSGPIGEACQYCVRLFKVRFGDFEPIKLAGNEMYGVVEQHPDAMSTGIPAALIDWSAFWEDEDEDTERWLCPDIFAKGRAHAIYAAAKQGKSYVVLYICAALAAGRPLLGHPAQPPIHVLYLDYEMTRQDVRDRLEEFGYGPDVDLSHLHYAILPSIPGIDTEDGAKAVLRAATDVDAQLVVFDTVSRAVEGEENDNKTFHALSRTTGIALKAAGIAYARLDHAGKDAEKGQRGGSAKNDDVDVVVKLIKKDDGVTLKATHRRLSWYPETVELKNTTVNGDVTFTIPSAGTHMTPDGTAQCAKDMEALDLALDLGLNKTVAALRAAGQGRKRTTVAAALKYRLENINRMLVDAWAPVDKSPPSGSRPPGTTQSTSYVGTTQGTTLETPSDLREPPREPPGTTYPGQVVPTPPP